MGSVWMVISIAAVIGSCATCYCCLKQPYEDARETLVKKFQPAPPTTGEDSQKSTLKDSQWMTASGLSVLSKSSANHYRMKSSLGVEYTCSEHLSAKSRAPK